LGEYELFTIYFDSVMSSLLSYPKRNVLLRWSNIISDESGILWPNATISQIHQRDSGASLGFGEVTIA
ncbi:hypothetical protein EDC94DRAFT_520902, partial [Helicostylum pulchrum]